MNKTERVTRGYSVRPELRVMVTAMLLILFFSSVFGTLVYGADDEVEPSLSMPVEYVNYTIAWVNGSVFAKIDGQYPIYNSGFELLPMVYPTPPGTDNISLKLDGVEISWSNYTTVYPEDLHHTRIGDWSMIYTILDDISDFFVLEIHYEHPVQMINGSYMFLYDLNIYPYLSSSANISIAHFAVSMDINFTDLSVQTVALDESLNPINYTVTGEYPSTINVQMVSQFGKPPLGDLLFSFKAVNSEEQQIRWADWLIVMTVAGTLVAVVALFLYLRSKKKRG
ncbi:MAG TPA: hypothetical protein VF893_01800 [Candidatus Bathyarchaeia archaeon]